MGFSDMQRIEHIRELQRYLHDISYYDRNIPRIIPDGIYGAETADAVRQFQLQYGLQDNGEANPATWLAIVEVYRKLLDVPVQLLSVFPREIGETIGEGRDGFTVLVISAILSTLSRKYENLPAVEVDALYTAQLAQAVRAFQDISGLPQTGAVDRRTWNLLAAAVDVEI